MSIKRYVIGFGLSLLITTGVFGLVAWHIKLGHEFPPHEVLYPLLAVLAVVQLLIQIVFFLHLGDDQRPRWKILSFFFAGVVVAILVGGTLWIMSNLAQGHSHSAITPYIDNVMTPATSND